MNIDEGVKSREGRIWAYTAVIMGNWFGVGFADLGQAGYTPAYIPSLPKGFDTFSKAADWCDAMNKARGLHPTDAVYIVADTMIRSRLKQEESKVDAKVLAMIDDMNEFELEDLLPDLRHGARDNVRRLYEAGMIDGDSIIEAWEDARYSDDEDGTSGQDRESYTTE